MTCGLRGWFAALVLGALSPAPAAAGLGVCAPRPGAAPRMYLDAVTAAPRDTLVQVRVCLTPPAGAGIASYHSELTYDTTLARAVRVDSHGGMQVANTNAPGTIGLAGVAPAGFEPGLLATVVLRRVTASAPGPIGIRVLELNDLAGASYLSSVIASGYGGGPRAGARPVRKPHIDSLAPRRGEIDTEHVLEIVMYGRGFTSSGNTVFFGKARAGVVPAEGSGSQVRFIAPSAMPASRGSTARTGPGTYAVHVENANGASNVVRFRVNRGEQ